MSKGTQARRHEGTARPSAATKVWHRHPACDPTGGTPVPQFSSRAAKILSINITKGGAPVAAPGRSIWGTGSWSPKLGLLLATLMLAGVADFGAVWPGLTPAWRCLPTCMAAEPADDDGDERFVVIKAGKIITNTDEDIHDGVIVLSGGKVHSVGRDLEYPLNSKVIDARDRVVMPGLIDPHTRYGLPRYKRGGVHGDLSVRDEYFPPPKVYDELLAAGYTALALVPAGDGIPGRAMVIRTAGPEDQRTLQSPSYLRVSGDKRVLRGALERAQKEIDKVEKARKAFEEKQKKAQEEQKKKAKQEKAKSKGDKKPATQPTTKPTTQPAFKPPPINPAHQALVDLIQKKPDIFALIELDRASDFVHMREVLEKFEIAHCFYAGRSWRMDLEYVVEPLGEQQAKIIIPPLITRTPHSAERIHLPRMLTDAGCEVSLSPRNDSPREYRHMLGRVAELVREGWPREAALKAITLHPANLLGLAERLGSIEKGKEADFIFLDADPLAPGARVREVMIGGEVVHRVEGDD